MEEIAPTFPNPPSPEPPVGPSMPVSPQPPFQPNVPPPQPPQSSKLKPILLAVALVLVIAASGGAGYFAYQNYFAQKPAVSPSPSLAPTSSPDPTVNWKTYTSNKIGYALKAPTTWNVRQNEGDSLLANQDYLVNLTLSPEPLEGITTNTIYIIFPISINGPHHDMGKMFEKGLEGLAVSDTTEPSSHFSKQLSSYTTIAGKRTLVTLKTTDMNPPTGFSGGWCGGCTQKNYYLDLGNGKILEISGGWTKDQPNFETIFTQILSTFKFTDQEETTNWKIFTDERFGFSLKYPPNWEKGSGAEGCGPIFGPKARSNPQQVLIYPWISVCTFYYSLPSPASFEESVKLYSSFGKVVSTTSGVVDSRRYVKVLKDQASAEDGDFGAIIIDNPNQDSEKASHIVVYIYYDSKNYQQYGSQQNFSVEEFLKTIDKIIATFKFTN